MGGWVGNGNVQRSRKEEEFVRMEFLKKEGKGRFLPFLPPLSHLLPSSCVSFTYPLLYSIYTSTA